MAGIRNLLHSGITFCAPCLSRLSGAGEARPSTARGSKAGTHSVNKDDLMGTQEGLSGKVSPRFMDARPVG